MIEMVQLTDPERKMWAYVLLQSLSDLSGRDPFADPPGFGFLPETIPSAVSFGFVITYRWSRMPCANAC